MTNTNPKSPQEIARDLYDNLSAKSEVAIEQIAAAIERERASLLELLPSDEWVQSEYEKFDNDKSRTQDDPKWPEWVATEHDYWDESAKVLRDEIRRRLEAALKKE